MSADTAKTRDLEGRTAVVTGGASGIGRACALRLAEAGAHVVVIDISADGAKETAGEAGGEYRVTDLSDLDAVDAHPVLTHGSSIDLDRLDPNVWREPRAVNSRR